MILVKIRKNLNLNLNFNLKYALTLFIYFYYIINKCIKYLLSIIYKIFYHSLFSFSKLKLKNKKPVLHQSAEQAGIKNIALYCSFEVED